MNHDVGVAANRRREMRVDWRGEAVMPTIALETGAEIDGLHHGTRRHDSQDSIDR